MKEHSVDIVCPLYNAQEYIESLHFSLLKQKNVFINRIIYILTESDDDSELILNRLNIDYLKIKKSEFSHSLVRENAAKNCNSDILVFITQDIVIERDDWLEKLVSPIINDEADACYSRQVSKYNNIEKYTREYNYPLKSVVKTKRDLNKMGLRTFFYSDASSAIKNEIFKRLNYYDGEDLPINEDMYIAYKLIINGYRIKYCADSIIFHSHNFKLKELYNRYKLTGMFFKRFDFIDQYGTNGSGLELAKYVLIRAFRECNFKVLVRFIPDMTARFIGMKVGKKNG